MYGSEVWGCLYGDILERGQLKFFKYILRVPSNVPSAYIRLECGRTHTKFRIFKRAIGWWVAILSMSDDRLPKLCFSRLLELESNFTLPFNWVSVLRTHLNVIGYEQLITISNVTDILKYKNDLIASYKNHMFSCDVDFAVKSSFNNFYRKISALEPSAESYLELIGSIEKLRVVAQLRLSNKKRFSLKIGSKKIDIFPENVCQFCNNGNNDLTHFLFKCSRFSDR